MQMVTLPSLAFAETPTVVSRVYDGSHILLLLLEVRPKTGGLVCFSNRVYVCGYMHVSTGVEGVQKGAWDFPWNWTCRWL